MSWATDHKGCVCSGVMLFVLQGFPGSGLVADSDIASEPLCIGQFFFCAILVMTALWRRLHVPYTMWPWRLAALQDPRVSQGDKHVICRDLESAKPCCLDFGFTDRIRSQFAAADNDDEKRFDSFCEKFSSVFQAVTIQKIINAEIENNFARCVSASKCARGRKGEDWNERACGMQHVATAKEAHYVFKRQSHSHRVRVIGSIILKNRQ